MSFLSFLAGLFTALLTGSILALYYDLIGMVVGVAVGALVAGTKKSGGAVGFLTAPIIMYSSLIIYILYSYFTGYIDITSLAIVTITALLNLYTIIYAITGMIIGILIAHINIKKIEKRETPKE